jgi:hypothetical protein
MRVPNRLRDHQRLTEAIAAALAGRVLTREELIREVPCPTGSAQFAAQVDPGDAQNAAVRNFLAA